MKKKAKNEQKYSFLGKFWNFGLKILKIFEDQGQGVGGGGSQKFDLQENKPPDLDLCQGVFLSINHYRTPLHSIQYQLYIHQLYTTVYYHVWMRFFDVFLWSCGAENFGQHYYFKQGLQSWNKLDTNLANFRHHEICRIRIKIKI